MIGQLFSLERSIPESVAMGVLSGKYGVHGGVIRDGAGRIVRHLVPAASKAFDPFGLVSLPFGIANTLQLRSLTKLTQEIQQLSQATMALSGLNLAVSAVGFGVMYASLKGVEQRVAELDRKVSWIKAFLDSGRRATILNASNELSSLPADPNHRSHILHQARESLGHVTMHYLAHWDEAADLLEAMAYQHYFCMAALMRARCSAELGMLDKSVIEIEQSKEEWVSRSRKIAKTFILKDNPERLLRPEFAVHAPAAKLAHWMDFSEDSNKGYDWIDALRERPNPFTLPSMWSKDVSKDEIQGLSHLENLTHRHQVLDGYVSQYKYLCEQGINPSDFDAQVKGLTTDSLESDILILAPTAEVQNFSSEQPIVGAELS